MTTIDPDRRSCPAPAAETERVLLGHGSGGRLSADLLAAAITCELGEPGPLEDAALVGRDLVVSTDGFVVTPRFFPGGDIGSLAVHGTVNDLAMRGARPIALTLAYILEEGLPQAELRAITASVAAAASGCGVRVVTGDTKVVSHGAADGCYLTTTGIGELLPGAVPSASGGKPGDVVLLSGPIGAHGTAILSVREGLEFESGIRSDSRPLHGLVAAMIETGGPDVHALRDPTRGGLASALNELAEASDVTVEIAEADIPVPAPVAAACELLGLDPLHVANEGCLVAFVAPGSADAILAAMHGHPAGRDARAIGFLRPSGGPAPVVARTLVGSTRIVDLLIGEQLPRIC
ncbi:hydrogenase expression/formation protein HypE [Amycolatopsis sp. FU40]|uniref:hydrogenase expression/formation protein HypE n=1 Tax=Amycolatopsis sp. FU40 TaxID=2914159 RepID=UPI001F266ABF|nr:hydrogenase expression/formation protein HypE [Amycolatopsis sp. FU40]UKD57450.1 hydrogenase expression/formation protein HypE [Amycolatopsis sp. FU40]